MSLAGFHVDLKGLAEVIFAVSALVTAWRGQKSIKRKAMEDKDGS